MYDNKLNKLKYNLTIECCEYQLKFPISARHCSMSIGINPQNNQPSNINSNTTVMIYPQI